MTCIVLHNKTTVPIKRRKLNYKNINTNKSERENEIPCIKKTAIFLHKMVFTRPDPPMTYPEDRFAKFVIVLKISAIKLQIHAITV